MNYFFAKTDKEQVKIDNEIIEKFRTTLKKQFCQVCQKTQANKVAYGKQFKPVFTCAKCQLQAVGGQVQKLGPKTLISIEKFIEILTKQLINYQTCKKNPPIQHKKSNDICESQKQNTNEICEKVKQQYKKMKMIVKEKHQELLNESNQQNTVLIFEEVNKIMKEKKMGQLDQGKVIVKRSLVSSQGVHFSDQQGIEAANESINEKFTNVKKQSRIKLKPLEDLIDEINKIEF